MRNLSFLSSDEGGSPSPDKPIGADGILSILNEADDDVEDLELHDKSPISANAGKKEVSKDTGDDDKSDESDDEASEAETEEEDELKEIEEELGLDSKEESDDELELVQMPRRKEILAKYPKLFKDFPGLEQAYFRERQYSEVFPTIRDAKEAVDKVKILNDFEDKLLSGDLTTVLKAVKDESAERGTQSYFRVIDQYLPSLRNVDEQAYYHVLGTVVKGVVFNMVKDAKNSGDENLQNAAQVLNHFIFGTSSFTPPQQLAKPEDSTENAAESRITERERDLQDRQFKSARDTLSTKTERIFEKAIVKNIDPTEVMSPYVKKTAIRDAQENLARLLGGDTRFRSLLDKAWRVAFDRNFDSDSMERIEKIIKSRAANILPVVIRKARTEALRGIGKRVKSEDTDDDNSDNEGTSASSSKRGPLRENKAPLKTGGKTKNEVPKGMSNRDFIMSD